MRKILTIALLVLTIPCVSHAQTVDEIIAKNIQAHGGAEKTKSITTRRITGKINADGLRITIIQENKRPDKVREEARIQGMSQIQAYDGKSAWQVNPFGGRRDAELLSADDLKGLQVDADMDGPLMDYQKKGHKAELVGHDSVEGTDCYKIKLTLKNGDIRTYYLDADSFLELKLETQTTIRGTIQESETYFGDYEKVDGLYFPFSVEQGRKGDSNRQILTVEKIEQNPTIADTRFEIPVTKAPGGAK